MGARREPPSRLVRAGSRPVTTTPTATKTTYRDAIRAALRDALSRDARVFLMGEDVGRYGGAFKVSYGLLDEFGPERVRDTPLSESTFLGAGIGAALGGMRPIVEKAPIRMFRIGFGLIGLSEGGGGWV